MSLWRTALGASLWAAESVQCTTWHECDADGAMCHFSPFIVALSVILAVGFRCRAPFGFPARTQSQIWRFANAVVMALHPNHALHRDGGCQLLSSNEAADLSHAVDVSTLGVIELRP